MQSHQGGFKLQSKNHMSVEQINSNKWEDNNLKILENIQII